MYIYLRLLPLFWWVFRFHSVVCSDHFTLNLANLNFFFKAVIFNVTFILETGEQIYKKNIFPIWWQFEDRFNFFILKKRLFFGDTENK